MPPQTDLDRPNHAPPAGRGYRKEVIVLLLFLLLPAIGFYVLTLERRGIGGVYLIGGGLGFLHIEDSAMGPQVEQFNWAYYGGASKWTLRSFRGLRLESEPGSWSSGPPSVMRIHFRPSATHAGDFDLVGIDDIRSGTNWYDGPLFWLKRVWAKPTGILGAPILRFLHRMDDTDVLQYLNLAAKEPRPLLAGHGHAPSTTSTLFAPSPNSVRLLELARAMGRRSPEDPYAALLQMDALLRAAKPEEIDALLTRWRPEITQLGTSDPSPTALLKLIEERNRALHAAQQGTNAFGAVLELLGRDRGTTAMLESFAQMVQYEDLSTPGGYTMASDNVLNFLEAQTRTKAANTYATLELLHGNSERALQLALGAYRFGQLIQGHDDFLISQLIGIALRAISARTLALIVANGPLTAEQCAHLAGELDRFAQMEAISHDVVFTDYSLPLPIPSSYSVNYQEARTRHDVSFAKFQAVRVLVAARHHLISTGQLPNPAASATLPPLLPKGPGRDPFSPTSGPLQMLYNVTSNTLVTWSVGPDQVDDRAAVQYDPTNGTISGGDVYYELPAVPVYPIPAGGVRADSTATLHAMFPAGLPPDFCQRGGTPAPLEATETSGTVLVYSVGPDGKEEDYTDGTAVKYDPTNGTVSGGDLVTTIPR